MNDPYGGRTKPPTACHDQGVGTEKDRMLRGEPYLANHPDLLLERRQCRLVCERFNATSFAQTAERRAILDELLGHLGPGCRGDGAVRSATTVTTSASVRGRSSTTARSCSTAPKVTIGEDVQIGPSVQLLTALHPLDPIERRRGTETAKPVTIGDGAWLATGVIVLPGVSIGADTVVGAGSVVTKDLAGRSSLLRQPLPSDP